MRFERQNVSSRLYCETTGHHCEMTTMRVIVGYLPFAVTAGPPAVRAVYRNGPATIYPCSTWLRARPKRAVSSCLCPGPQQQQQGQAPLTHRRQGGR